MQHPVQTARSYYKKQMTPPEYYSKIRPVSFSPTSGSAASESDSTIPETKNDRMNVALIGILAGAVVVAGIVVPIVLLNK